MAEELRAHAEHRADDLEAAGMARADAERQARVELGAVESYKEAMRDERSLGRTRRVFEQTFNDLRLGVRRLRRAPLYALFAMGSIGIGAGITTAMFAIVQDTFWPTSGIRDAADVVLLANQINGRLEWDRTMSLADFEDYHLAQTSLVSVVGSAKFSQSLSLPVGTQLVSGEAVTDGYFQALGVAAALGRVLQEADGQPDAPAVMVLSDQLWRRGFASDPAVIGQVVRFGGAPFQIVGVVNRGYRGLNARMPRFTGLWIAAAAQRRLTVYGAPTDVVTARNRLTMTVAGRLKPGVPSGRALAEAQTFGAGLDTSFPVTTTGWDGAKAVRIPARRQWSARPVEETLAFSGPAPAIILAIFGLVLLVACTNLANLSLARGTSREAELGVRLALGASRSRLVRELSAESVVIGAGGFVLATFISMALMSVVSADLPVFNGQNASVDPHLNLSAVAAAAFAVGLALLVCGLWPALKLSRGDARSAMAAMKKTGAIVAPGWRTERILIRVQMVVSVAFFCAASGFITALLTQNRLDPGVDLDRLTVAQTVFRLQMWDEARSQQAVNAIASAPPGAFGFRSVALSSSMPFGSTTYAYANVAREPANLTAANMTLMMAATPRIFETLGIPLVAGRPFDHRDIAGTEPVIVISETLALSQFGSTDVVGRQLAMRGGMNSLDNKRIETRTVIGVTRDTDVGSLSSRREGLLFVPLAQRYEPPNFVVGRTDTGETQDLRALIRSADPDVAVASVGSGMVMLAGAWMGARIIAAIAMLLGGMTLVLTMAGLFGVLSALVSRRTKEIGIRKALGADNAAVRRMILRDGARPVASGTAIGLFLGVLAGFLIRAAIPGGPTGLTLVALGIVMLTVVPATLAACYLPALRAMRVNPNVTLKDA